MSYILLNIMTISSDGYAEQTPDTSPQTVLQDARKKLKRIPFGRVMKEENQSINEQEEIEELEKEQERMKKHLEEVILFMIHHTRIRY